MITILIIIASVAASFYAWNNEDVYRRWLLNPYMVVHKKQYDRFITSGFIHADQTHLFVNMLSFYFFGRNLEGFLGYLYGDVGMLYYLGFYLLAIIVADVPTFLKHKKDYRYNSLGASGAVAAVLFAVVIISPLSEIRLFFIIPVTAVVFAILYLIYSYVSAQKQSGGINHDAHFYGALFGMLFIVFIEPRLINNFFDQLSNWSIF